MTRPDPQTMSVLAAAAGMPVDKETATRMSSSIGPAIEGFAVIAGTLPFDLEPATFTLVQASTS